MKGFLGARSSNLEGEGCVSDSPRRLMVVLRRLLSLPTCACWSRAVRCELRWERWVRCDAALKARRVGDRPRSECRRDPCETRRSSPSHISWSSGNQITLDTLDQSQRRPGQFDGARAWRVALCALKHPLKGTSVSAHHSVTPSLGERGQVTVAVSSFSTLIARFAASRGEGWAA